MENILERINLPEDLKKLTTKELVTLAFEIRQEIIDVVAKNGGHLASNLGVVELSIALHAVLDSPKDKIVWDVGHQSYVHKILTGRKKRFDTLRQWEGISGFPKPDESPHDAFATGHSSTSISAALGLAEARDLAGDDYHIVAVIGDGSMTGGMAFEALNHAGHLQSNLLVILNDNEMSIDPNVGALSGYLSRLRMHPRIHHLKETIEDFISKMPRLGKAAVRYLEKIKDSLTYLFIPGIIFEELGFTYFGPIDGHNIPLLKTTIQDALAHGGPVLIHVTTRKGKGYLPAEQDPSRFHSTAPFEMEAKQSLSVKAPSYTEVFGKTLAEIGQRDARLIAITAAMTEGTGLTCFAERYPERFFDVGIAEQHAVTFAAGLARGGLRPVVAVYSTFLQRAYDQILHDICLQKLPVVFCLDRAGVVGNDGPTHHGVFDLAFLRHMPNMVIMSPKDENEFRHMLWTALHYNDGPVAIRYPKGAGEGVAFDDELRVLPIGQSELLCQGQNATVVALGNMVYPALKAVDKLARNGIECTLINSRFIKPLDHELILESVTKTRRLLTVEDHVLAGGFGSAILELMNDAAISDLQIERLGYPDTFLPQGTIQQLHQAYGLTEEGIYHAVSTLTLPKIQANR